VLFDLIGHDPDAEAMLDTVSPDRSARVLHAPEVVVVETLHTLRRHVRGGRIAGPAIDEALEELRTIPIRLYPHLPLVMASWALRDNLTAYDAAYVALAQSLPGSTLLTGDRAMAAVAGRVLGEDRVRLV
jgi:predicted nucleic acid-binding protein